MNKQQVFMDSNEKYGRTKKSNTLTPQKGKSTVEP